MFEDDKPVFIAGIGPRTGTTLVQRIINSHPDAWIWGEMGKNAESDITSAWDKINWSRETFAERDKFLYQALNAGMKLEFSWVASLVPSKNRFWQAWRGFFEVGFRTKRIWGFKAVTCAHLRFMRELFPRAHIIVTFRSPINQYKSYRAGINNIETPETMIAKLKAEYDHYRNSLMAIDLSLDLDDFDKEPWIKVIFNLLEEPIPKNALKAAMVKVRGPVLRSIDALPSDVEERIHRELDPLYSEVKCGL